VSLKQLTDLMSVFDRLEAGESVALRPADTISVRSRKAPAGVYLGVYSSGSTGRPKLVWRPWDELLCEVRVHRAFWGWTWASSFSPESFAGVQVALQAWCTEGAILSLGSDWVENWHAIHDDQPQALSCTPTFLDLLLQFEKEDSWMPQQITLGGEVLRPTAGRRFRARFPNTRFTVIYAAAEHGVLLKTHQLDGWYESAGLGEHGKTWRVKERVLQLHKGGAWVNTGDRVEVSGARVRLIGRADAVVNVGGAKVSLDEITNLAEEVPGVRRAVAYALPSSVVGQIVALRFELDPKRERAAVQPRLEMHLRTRLRKEAWPRHWEVGAVALGSNSKRVSG
jgi:acyl-coenzyme A synthetase/AMP-(fatty) acid ligase